MTYFSDLGIAEPVLRALDAKGYSDPTPIQRQAIPALLEGRDLLGIAQTGTGKTAAFALPSIHRLAADPKPRQSASCRMLVLSPTRELAAQIAENMRLYSKFLRLSVQCVFGGVPAGKQARALVPGCDILVATPGRLLDLIDQRALTLRNVEIFVLDEADQMMDLGFIHALKRIAGLLPPKRQSLFFSATMPKAIAELGRQFIQDPVRVEVTPQATTAERVEQYATYLNQTEKQALLTLRLRGGLADGSIDRALVFSRTKHGADRVVRHLISAGVRAVAIHGNKSQGQRTGAIRDFRSGDIRVLVATDIAARGIDIPGVSHVFNYELPNVPEQYVHRIGRTARNGADGIAIAFVAPDERAYLRDIERLTRVKLDVLPLPENFLAEAARLPLPARKTAGEDQGEARQGRGRGDRAQGRSERKPRAIARPRETHAGNPRGTPAEAQAGRPSGPRRDDRPARTHAHPRGEQARSEQSRGEHPRNAHPRSERPRGERPQGDRPYGDRSYGDRPRGEHPRGPRQGQPRDARDGQQGQPRNHESRAQQPNRTDRNGGHGRPGGHGGHGGQGRPGSGNRRRPDNAGHRHA